jgi:hypothetical protein
MAENQRHLYEQLVRALAEKAAEMRAEGVAAETIARSLNAERRALAARFKERTPEPLRSRIYAHTLAVYGDPLGPSIEYLRSRGKSWDQIIEAAARPGVVPADGDVQKS